MASSNGGRRRGRPRIYTPERKLELERERDRFKKAAKRKREADAKWQRGTNFGYFERLWVPHPNELSKVLVAAGFVHENDIDLAPRIDAGVDELFEWLPAEHSWELRLGRSRRLVGTPGTVRIRMTAELADRLVAWGCRDEFQRVVLSRRHRRPEIDPGLAEEYRRAETHYRRCRAADWSYTTSTPQERVRIREEHDRAFDAYWKLERQLPPDPAPPGIDEDELADFAESLRHNRVFLRNTAETALIQYYSAFVFDPPEFPCNCKLALPKCDCLSRFKPDLGPGVLQGPAKPKGPKAKKVLAKRSLYSGPEPRWWRNPRHDDDPIIRSHDKSAGVGMKGFYAGSSKGACKNENAIYYNEQDNCPTTRDRNRTARQGEKALQKPYDDPEGTQKPWSNPSHLAPDNEDGIIQIGKRVIEDGVIEPSKKDN